VYVYIILYLLSFLICIVIQITIKLVRCFIDCSFPELQGAGPNGMSWDEEVLWGEYLRGKTLEFYFPPNAVNRPQQYQPVVGAKLSGISGDALVGTSPTLITLIIDVSFCCICSILCLAVVGRAPSLPTNEPGNRVNHSCPLYCCICYIN